MHTSGWKLRLSKNRIAITCLIILSMFSIVALFGYFIIPDNTTNANRQIVQLALSPPGLSQSFLLKDRAIKFPKENLLEVGLYGKRERKELIPVDSMKIEIGQVVSYFKGMMVFHDDLNQDNVIIKNKRFVFGTDKYGRDVLSRLVLGLRVSIVVGFLSVIVSLGFGISIGSLGGFYGGWIDKILMLVINTAWSIPTLLMAFAIIIVLGKGFMVIVLAVGLTMWVDVARIVRGQTMEMKNELFIKASKILGFSDFRTITIHILPNISGAILVIAAANFATAILVEAGLSFLGLGIQPPTPSLGNMLQESYAYATGGFVYLAFFPILTIMVLVLSFNLLGTALRDVFDIKSIR